MKRIHCILIYLFNFVTLPIQDSCIIHSSLLSGRRKGIGDREKEKKGRGLRREGKGPSLPFFSLSRFSLPPPHLPLFAPDTHTNFNHASVLSSSVTVHPDTEIQPRHHSYLLMSPRVKEEKEAFTRERIVRTQNMAHVTGKTKR